MDINAIKGIIPPIITPIEDNEDVDEKSLRKVINYCISNGLHGIFIAGSAGETMSLTAKQRNRAINITLEEVGGRVPVFCGVMDSGTRKVVENIKMLEQAGGEIAVVTPPFYIKNSCQSEVIRHFEKIAGSTSVKIMIYNIPANTQVNILPKTVAELSNIQNIIGIKDSSSNWIQFQQLMFLLKGKNFKIFQGNPELAAVSFLIGADGLTPVYSIIMPNIYKNLYKEAKNGNIDRAFEIQKIVSSFNNINKLSTSHISIQKFAISLLGLSGKNVTYPCKPLSEAEEDDIREFIKNYMEVEGNINSSVNQEEFLKVI
ncbi:MAG: dihydrodipicolinate synthase family protein [Ruminiclostridium sp.]|nr:dihydrodipicolinate synthase family protein [Ruminiclostridium sp.]